MSDPVSQGRRADQSGFTLIELLVVLGIMALALAIAAPSLHRARSGPVVRSAAYELAGALRSARAASQLGNVEHVLTIDVARRRYWAHGVAPVRQLPEQVLVDLWVPDSERVGGGGRVRFFPDGSASGARVVLQDHQTRTAVFVDWLDGSVRVHMRP